MLEKNKNLSYNLKTFFEKYSIWLILLFAFIIRLKGLGYGLPYLHSPSGEIFLNPTIKILLEGDLNPHWFRYPGSFIMYLLAVLFIIIGGAYFIYYYLVGYVHNLGDFIQLRTSNPTLYINSIRPVFCFSARLSMVFFAIVTIYLVYLVAKRLFNKPTGILAAFCLAIAPLHVLHSRFIAPDITATMLIMSSLYFLLGFFDQNKNRKLLILSSLFAGFSIATKYPSAIIVFPILIYCLISDVKQKRFLLTGKTLLFIFTGFFIFAPFVILDFQHAIKDIIYIIIYEARGTHLGHESLPGIQNYIWYLKNALQNGIGGLFFEMFAGAGLLLISLKKSYKRCLFLVFPIFYFLLIGSARLRWHHWAIPIIPFEAILFAVGFYSAYSFLIRKEVFQTVKPKILSLFAAAMIFFSFPPIIDDIKTGVILSRQDTRTMLIEWIISNLPTGSKIVCDTHWSHLRLEPIDKFTVMNTAFVKKPFSYYKSQSADYVITTDGYIITANVLSGKRRFYNEPDRYAKEVSRYEELKNNAELIKVFDNKENPGPIIEIYKLK